jgi:hypothetical protein
MKKKAAKWSCYILIAAAFLGMFIAIVETRSEGENKDLAEAERILATLPRLSVIDSPRKAPSHDIHDYISFSTYAWPNPDSPDGLPYIMRDGQTNPETNDYPDRKNLDTLITSVRVLVSAYNKSHAIRFAKKAIDITMIWFLMPDTKMNPNLNYAQIVPGKNNGMGNPSGIIETHNFVDLIDSLTNLETSYDVPPAFKAGIRAWFREYLNWLQTSENGQNAQKFKNNQLSWYTAQEVAISEYIGNDEIAKDILEDFIDNHLADQIDGEGRQVEELKRTNSFNYSLLNLQALFKLADLGSKVGIDLWHYKLGNNAGIETALEFLIPYATGRKKWPYQEIQPYDPSLLQSVLNMAIKAYPEKQDIYKSALSNMKVF